MAIPVHSVPVAVEGWHGFSLAKGRGEAQDVLAGIIKTQVPLRM